MDDEPGGVGDISGKPFMWMINGNIVTASFDSGETVVFKHGEEGWLELIMLGLILTKSV